MKKNNNTNILFYIYTLLIIVFAYEYNSIKFENQDFDAITKILNPNFPKGGVSYDPHLHYNYFASFIIFIFNINSSHAAKIIWLLEQSAIIFALYKISVNFFSKSNIILVLVISFYLLTKSGETDQKTFLLPFYLFSLYFLLKNQYFISGLFCSALFYLHIGSAIWWFAPSGLALLSILIVNPNKINLKNLIFYSSTVIFLSSPVLIFYIYQDTSFTESSFFKNYWYGLNNSLISLSYERIEIIILTLSPLLIFIFSYLILINDDDMNNNVKKIFFSIFIGVIILLFLNHLLVEIFYSGTVIKLQLIRSIENIKILSFFFISFILFKQINRGNYFFLLIIFFLIIPNPLFIIYNYYNSWLLLYLVFLIIVFYEILILKINFKISFLTKIKNNSLMRKFEFIKNSKFLIIIIINFNLIAYIATVSGLEDQLKYKLFKIGKSSNQIIISKHESLLVDIVSHINSKINDNSLFLAPFTNGDFAYLTKQKVFVNKGSIYDYIPKKTNIFKEVFHEDLGYSVEEMKDAQTWFKIWKNIDENKILEWQKKYGITHVIREKDLPLNFIIKYSNKHYNLYEL